MNDTTKTKRAPLPPSPDYVSQKDVAAYCCVTVAAVSQGIKRGTWPFRFLRVVRLGRRMLITRASFAHMTRVMKGAVEATAADVVAIDEGRRKSA
jgi:hypothetical protein